MSLTIHHGDALAVLRTMPESTVHCCVTSPPYWGLRDYDTAQWEGGAADCDHSYKHGVQGNTGQPADRTFTAQAVYRDICRKCGAARIDQQIGLEKTREEYVARMVAVFSEVRRVLRPDGTLWLNIGDSYSNDTKWGGSSGGKNSTSAAGGYQGQRVRRGSDCDPKAGKRALGQPMGRCNGSGLKPKDLVGIPWMLAFALRANGWYLRSEIIWHKPNPMPESVTDRPTKAHEQIFLLAKSERYYYDAGAIMESASFLGPNGLQKSPYAQGFGRRSEAQEAERREKLSSKRSGKSLTIHGNLPGRDDGGRACNRPGQERRNRRSVWTVQTEPFPEAHFATFPTKLIQPCILAGCPVGGTVLDPFTGAGTTALVAKETGRNFIGIELNPAYIEIAHRRIAQEVLPLHATELPLTPEAPPDGVVVKEEANA